MGAPSGLSLAPRGGRAVRRLPPECVVSPPASGGRRICALRHPTVRASPSGHRS